MGLIYNPLRPELSSIPDHSRFFLSHLRNQGRLLPTFSPVTHNQYIPIHPEIPKVMISRVFMKQVILLPLFALRKTD